MSHYMSVMLDLETIKWRSLDRHDEAYDDSKLASHLQIADTRGKLIQTAEGDWSVSIQNTGQKLLVLHEI